jgi:hypothetical protein
LAAINDITSLHGVTLKRAVTLICDPIRTPNFAMNYFYIQTVKLCEPSRAVQSVQSLELEGFGTNTAGLYTNTAGLYTNTAGLYRKTRLVEKSHM